MQYRLTLNIPIITLLYFLSFPETGDQHFFTPVVEGEPVTDDGSSRGVAWADYGQNGYPDLVVANTMNNSNFVYRNEGDGSFFQVTEDPISYSGEWSEGIYWTDIDNDHDLDLFVANQWEGPNQLFINNEGSFEPALDAGDLLSGSSNSPAACWADYNLDGYMDVYVITRDDGDDALYRNNGDGTFSRISDGNISSNGGDGRACAWGDLDGDRYPELYVGNFINRNGESVSKAQNFLYKNNGDGSFTEITEGDPVTDRAVTYGVSMIDFDYDEDLDIYVTNIAGSDTNILYENDGNGEFSKTDLIITKESNRPSKGHTWGDFNNDGFIDLFVANGTMNVDPEKIKNQLYLGSDSGEFTEIKGGTIVNKQGTSAGAAWADYDRDGDLDLFVANWAHNNEDNEFYRNDINECEHRNWIVLQLEGTQSNKFGIGAKIRLKAAISGNDHWQTRWLWPDTGYGSQNETIVHFGLGDANQADSLEIEWPSGVIDRFTDIGINRYYRAEEDGILKPVN
ncbi:MAG: CRTAC1 family protein [Balneolaceae bacterium]|nr:CRTAC1 family protein [Balneolaceae bacterium]